MSDIPPQLDSSLANALSELLKQCHFEEAIATIKDNRYSEALKNNPADLIPALIQNLSEQTSPELRDCCMELLNIIAKESNPEDAMFEFLELIEPSENTARFSLGLTLLQISLLRIEKRHTRPLEWCLNSILLYVQALPLPKNLQLEGKETLLLDADPRVQTIFKLYNDIEEFYYPFISECNSHSISTGFTQKNKVLCFLLQLLGRPLGHLNLEPEHPKSTGRSIADKIVFHISTMISDMYMFLPYAEERCLWKKRYASDGVHEESVQNIFLNEEKTPLLSLAVLYYLILSENTYKIPGVYSREFIALTSLYLSVELLNSHEQFVVKKGLALARDSLNIISLLSYQVLNNPVHKIFCKMLTNVICYFDCKSDRQFALSLFNTYLFKFDYRGRYLIINNLCPTLDHSGLLGYCIITCYKDMVNEALSENSTKPSYYFSGKRLLAVLNIFTKLPDGAETDLMDVSDQIISVLNLLLFLLIRDKKNITSIWAYFIDISKTFLEPLREGLKLSKAHYEVKKKDLIKEQKQNKLVEDESNKVQLTVAGSNIIKINIEQRLNVVYTALNVFDVMESILIRVNEYFAMKHL